MNEANIGFEGFVRILNACMHARKLEMAYGGMIALSRQNLTDLTEPDTNSIDGDEHAANITNLISRNLPVPQNQQCYR